jgi:hypothetical protein
MATTDDFKTNSTIHDLTDVNVNPFATTTSTPRQGGFTVRNRIDFDNLDSALANQTMPASAVVSTSKVQANVLWLLDIPKRTTVKTIHVYAVAGEAHPSHAYEHNTAGASVSSSDVVAHTLQFGTTAYKSTSQSSLAAVVVGNFGEFDIGAMAKSSSVISTSMMNAGVPNAVSVSSTTTPTNCVARVTVVGANGAQSASSYDNDVYMPFGGKVLMHLDGDSAWETGASEADDYLGRATGVWEIQADCNYVPE